MSDYVVAAEYMGEAKVPQAEGFELCFCELRDFCVYVCVCVCVCPD